MPIYRCFTDMSGGTTPKFSRYSESIFGQSGYPITDILLVLTFTDTDIWYFTKCQYIGNPICHQILQITSFCISYKISFSIHFQRQRLENIYTVFFKFQAQMIRLAVHTIYSSSVHLLPWRKPKCQVKTGDMDTWAELNQKSLQVGMDFGDMLDSTRHCKIQVISHTGDRARW